VVDVHTFAALVRQLRPLFMTALYQTKALPGKRHAPAHADVTLLLLLLLLLLNVCATALVCVCGCACTHS
jgi:hypothetical protein